MNWTADQILDAISGQESSGGRNTNHVTMTGGANVGQAAVGNLGIMPNTWKQWGQQGHPGDYTDAQQRDVARGQIQGWLDQGDTAQNVASRWYSGNPEINDGVRVEEGHPLPSEYVNSIMTRLDPQYQNASLQGGQSRPQSAADYYLGNSAKEAPANTALPGSQRWAGGGLFTQQDFNTDYQKDPSEFRAILAALLAQDPTVYDRSIANQTSALGNQKYRDLMGKAERARMEAGYPGFTVNERNQMARLQTAHTGQPGRQIDPTRTDYLYEDGVRWVRHLDDNGNWGDWTPQDSPPSLGMAQASREQGFHVSRERFETMPEEEITEMLSGVQRTNWRPGLSPDLLLGDISDIDLTRQYKEFIEAFESPTAYDLSTPERLGRYRQRRADFERRLRVGAGRPRIGDAPEVDTVAPESPYRSEDPSLIAAQAGDPFASTQPTADTTSSGRLQSLAGGVATGSDTEKRKATHPDPNDGFTTQQRSALDDLPPWARKLAVESRAGR